MESTPMTMEERYFAATVKALREQHPDFKSVDLSGHDITTDKMIELSECLASNKVVNTLEFFGLKAVGLNGWKALVSSLPSQLVTLDLGACALGQASQEMAELVLGGLSHLTQLEELDLNGNGINHHIVPNLCESLAKMPHLRELMIQNNQLGNEGAKAIASCIKAHNTNIEMLWLQTNGLDQDGKRAVQSELAGLPSLHRIELGND